MTPSAAVSSSVEKKEVPWRGSSFSYGHAFSAVSLSKEIDGFYNPYYVQSVSLFPEWHFTSFLFVRARFDIEQELTVADDTNTVNEVVISDLPVDVGTDSYQEELTGIKVTGTLRFGLPTSRLSRMQTRVFSIGPGVSLSRKFPVLSGLTLSYAGRYTQRFHRFTTPENEGASISGCNILRGDTCDSLMSNQKRNVMADVVQGPKLVLDALESLHVELALQMAHGFLYPLTPVEASLRLSDQAPDSTVRVSTTFALGATYDLTRELSLSLSLNNTAQPQLGDDGHLRNPFFTRNNTVSLDAAIDVEALLSRI
ncbi:MAG: hypothetical protein ACYC8T_10150 [Myxococcaceae bacterium]